MSIHIFFLFFDMISIIANRLGKLLPQIESSKSAALLVFFIYICRNGAWINMSVSWFL